MWCHEYFAAPLATSVPQAPAPANTASRKRTHSDDGAEADQSVSKRPRLHDEATADEPQCLLTRFEWTQHSTLKQTTTTTMSACSPPTAQSERDSECPICQETVSWCAPARDTDTDTIAADGDLVQWALVRHECGNTFHSTCLDPWCAARRDGATTCPMCRGVILDPPAPAPAQNEDGNLHGPQSGLDANLQLELFGGSTLSSPTGGQSELGGAEGPSGRGFLSEEEASAVMSFLSEDRDFGGFGSGPVEYEDDVDVSDVDDEDTVVGS